MNTRREFLALVASLAAIGIAGCSKRKPENMSDEMYEICQETLTTVKEADKKGTLYSDEVVKKLKDLSERATYIAEKNREGKYGLDGAVYAPIIGLYRCASAKKHSEDDYKEIKKCIEWIEDYLEPTN